MKFTCFISRNFTFRDKIKNPLAAGVFISRNCCPAPQPSVLCAFSISKSLEYCSVVHICIKSMSRFIAIDVGCHDFLISTWSTSTNMSIGNEVTFILNDSQKRSTPYTLSIILILGLRSPCEEVFSLLVIIAD